MSLKIIKAGILDTIQDGGRTGYQHLGINPSGAMDVFSASLANVLLGKDLASPVIELHFPAAEILFQTSAIVCISGADYSPHINDIAVPLLQPLFINENAVLKFKRWNTGARCYLSILDDMKLEKWIESYSTNLKTNAGGYDGRALKKDDVIFCNKKTALPFIDEAVKVLQWKADFFLFVSKVACIMGNEWDRLTSGGKTIFSNGIFRISKIADRMGYRLEGEPLRVSDSSQLVSSGVNFGTIQLLPEGQLIVLMADHQTTGGYPRIAHVISADLPHLAQMRPNDEVNFYFITLAEAEQKLIAQHKYLLQLQNACKFKIENFINAAM
ncbi:MAG: biotin-dependent carboxyltransferase family protein [Chitinophagaceae bacterium]|nr:biotin-dependent carboxyltransferase family protein [Chitinophagaceae bacterium]